MCHSHIQSFQGACMTSEEGAILNMGPRLLLMHSLELENLLCLLLKQDWDVRSCTHMHCTEIALVHRAFACEVIHRRPRQNHPSCTLVTINPCGPLCGCRSLRCWSPERSLGSGRSERRYGPLVVCKSMQTVQSPAAPETGETNPGSGGGQPAQSSPSQLCSTVFCSD